MLEEYIDDASKPTGQPEPRLSEFFDKTSIVNEMFLSMEQITGMRAENDVRRVFYLFMFMGEENANSYKRFKVVSEDIAFSLKIFSLFAERARQDTDKFKRFKEIIDEVSTAFAGRKGDIKKMLT